MVRIISLVLKSPGPEGCQSRAVQKREGRDQRS